MEKDNNNKSEIVKGLVVAFKDTKGDRDKEGYYRVTSLKGGKVNLGSVFGKTIYFKGIPVDDVMNREAEWYEAWTRSDAYQCM
jgi:hypothetical protein